MLEMKITIAAPDLAAAINSLALAMEGSHKTECIQHGKNNTHIDNAGTVNLDATGSAKQPVAPVAPVNPTQAPGAQATVSPAPTQHAPGVPLSATPAQTVAPVANTAPAAVPTAAPQYTLEMIATAGSALIDAGKLDQLMALLGKFGVDSLTNLAPEYYGAVAQELRALGARI